MAEEMIHERAKSPSSDGFDRAKKRALGFGLSARSEEGEPNRWNSCSTIHDVYKRQHNDLSTLGEHMKGPLTHSIRVECGSTHVDRRPFREGKIYKTRPNYRSIQSWLFAMEGSLECLCSQS